MPVDLLKAPFAATMFQARGREDHDISQDAVFAEIGESLEQTLGDYSTSRTVARYGSGNFGDGNAAHLSFMRQDARAWDFNGKPGGQQLNAKIRRRPTARSPARE